MRLEVTEKGLKGLRVEGFRGLGVERGL